MRAAAEASVARRHERWSRLLGWTRLFGRSGLSRPRQTGILARRRRLRVRALLAGLLLLNVLFWFVEPAGAMRALVLLVSVLAAPVLYTVLFRKA